jgi:hypothetical protein
LVRFENKGSDISCNILSDFIYYKSVTILIKTVTYYVTITVVTFVHCTDFILFFANLILYKYWISLRIFQYQIFCGSYNGETV